MAALVFAPPPVQFIAFPLVVYWQESYAILDLYFPDLQFGLLRDEPEQESFASILSPPKQMGLEAFKRDFHPGELSQWQAFLNYVAVQEHHDETDLKAAIRGQLEPVLPKEIDWELLWSLAYHLEGMLAEEQSVLKRLASQEQALEKALGEDVEEENELFFKTGLNPTLTDDLPDVTLARVRYRFWREILAPKLTTPWSTLVLETAAGKSSPRYLWEASKDEAGSFWQADFTLPDWRPQPGVQNPDVSALRLGVEFRKTLEELLQAVKVRPSEVEACRKNMQRLVEERLWPASGLPQAQAVYLEVFGWLQEGGKADLVSEPMVFLTPAG